MTGEDRKGDIGVGRGWSAENGINQMKRFLLQARRRWVWAVWPYPGDNQSAELDQIAGTWANSVSLDLSSRQEAW